MKWAKSWLSVRSEINCSCPQTKCVRSIVQKEAGFNSYFNLILEWPQWGVTDVHAIVLCHSGCAPCLHKCHISIQRHDNSTMQDKSRIVKADLQMFVMSTLSPTALTLIPNCRNQIHACSTVVGVEKRSLPPQPPLFRTPRYFGKQSCHFFRADRRLISVRLIGAKRGSDPRLPAPFSCTRSAVAAEEDKCCLMRKGQVLVELVFS